MILLLEKSLKKHKRDYIRYVKRELPSEDIKTIKNIVGYINSLGKKKGVHSLKVSSHVSKYSNDPDVIIGALFHDYIERGGKIKNLPISKKAKKIIKFLSSESKNLSGVENEPLEHLMNVVPEIKNEKLKNNIIIVKLVDRYDNLAKRGKNVSKNYLTKTKDLFSFLVQHYTGDKRILVNIANAMSELLRKNFSKKKSRLDY